MQNGHSNGKTFVVPPDTEVGHNHDRPQVPFVMVALSSVPGHLVAMLGATHFEFVAARQGPWPWSRWERVLFVFGPAGEERGRFFGAVGAWVVR